MEMYKFPMDDLYLTQLLQTDLNKYQAIIHNIRNAENNAVREMYEIDLFNGWF